MQVDNGRRQRLSIRLSGLKQMHKMGTLSDGQIAAAELFNTLWAFAKSDGQTAIDYTRPRVDGRGASMAGPTERRLWASKKLERIQQALGEREYGVLVIAAGYERGLGDVRAWLRCRATEASKLVKSALDHLSMMGVA